MGRIKNAVNRILGLSRKGAQARIGDRQSADPFPLHELSLSQFSKLLENIPYFEDKIDLAGLYRLVSLRGKYGIRNEQGIDEKLKQILFKNNLGGDKVAGLLAGIDGNINNLAPDELKKLRGFDKIHFACGGNYLKEWLNVDFASREQSNYLRLNLCELLPFPDGHFKFAFAEDFLEHLRQDDSIIFLAEAFRCLKEGGVLRLSFPGLEGVLKKHYQRIDQKLSVYEGKFEAYLYWDHLHFYSRDELRTVASHVGFSKTEYVQFGESVYDELCGLDTREHQKDLNTYVELTK